MANNNRLKMTVDFEVNKASVEDVKKALKEFQNQVKKVEETHSISNELKSASASAKELANILDKSWNNKLNQLDLSKVNNQIKQTYGSVGNLKKILESSGTGGAKAYDTFSRSILNTNLQLTESSKLLDSIATTMTNTVKWGVTSRIFNGITESIQKAWSYTVSLDKSLNDIRIVTDKSASDMERFAIQANKAAKALGSSTRDYTQGALIYYQQGLGDAESAARTEATLKAANVTGQTAREVSEQLTAVWNGYKVNAQETELYVDKLAATAAATAADLEELSTGMSKVASAANIMGVDIDQLNAQMATIISATRQAPESVGTALKTIYARMGDIEAGLDGETNLGKYTSDMATMGINVLNAEGKLRDMGEVIEEIGGKWESMSREQQIALSQTMAGTRQYNNLLSLFDNWDKYTKALETSANAAGKLQEQQDIYMESTDAHLQQLRTEAERTYNILFDQKEVNSFIDTMNGLLTVFNNFIDSLGGGANTFVWFGSLVARIMNSQIAGGIDNAIQRFENFKNNQATIDLMKSVVNEGLTTENPSRANYWESDLDRAEAILNIQRSITNEEFNELNTLRQKVTEEEAILEYLDKIEDGELKRTKIEADNDYRQIVSDKKKIKSKYEILDITEKINNVENNDKVKKEGTQELQKQVTLLQQYSYKTEQNILLEQIQEKLKDGQTLSEEDEEKLLQAQKEILTKINMEEEKRLAIKQAYEAKEKGIDSQLRADYNKDSAEFYNRIGASGRKGDIADIVSSVSFLIQSASSISGIMKTITNPDTSGLEKMGSIFNNLLGLSGSLLINFNSLSKGTNMLAMAMGAKGVTAATGFGGSLLGIIKVAGPYALAIGAIIGVTALLVKEYNKDADAAEKAAKKAEELKTKYQEVKTAYDELNSSIASYQSAETALKKMSHETTEWKKAVVELNEQVLKLMNLYPILSGYITNEDGVLGISDAGIEAVLQEQNKKLQDQMIETNLAQIDSNEKTLNSAITKFKRSGISYLDSSYTPQQQEDLRFQYKGMDMYNTLDGVIAMDSKQVDRLIEALRENGLSILQNSDALKGATGFNDNLSSALLSSNNSQAIIDLYNKIIQTENSNQILRTQTAQGLLNNNEIFKQLTVEDKAKVTEHLIDNLTEGQTIKDAVDNITKEDILGILGISDFGKYTEKVQKANLSGLDISGLITGLQTGKATSENIEEDESYKGLLNQLESIKNKYPELTAAAEELSETWNVGSQEYIEALEMIQDKLYETKIESLADTESKELEEFQNVLAEGISTENLDNFKKELDDVLNADYQIDVAIHTEAEQEFDSIVNAMDDIEKKASLIGEGFLVSANDVRELNNTFPGIIQNMEDVGDGSFRLNQQITEDAIAAAQAEVAADSQATVDKLQNQANLLRQKQESYSNLAEAAAILAQSETEDDQVAKDAQAKVSEELSKLEQLNKKAVEDYSSNSDKNIADSSKVNAGIMASNWAEAYQEAARNSYNFAVTAAQNLKAAAGQGNPVMGTFGSNYQGATGQSSEAMAINETQSLLTSTQSDAVKQQWANLSARYKQLAASAGKSANDIEGMIAGIGARTSNLGNTLGNIRSGYGSKGPSSSGGSGGGSGSSKEPNTIDYLDKEKDRYHDINIILKQIETSLNKLETQEKKLFGQDLINNLNEQLALLNNQIDATNRKIQIAQGELGELKSKLGGSGVLFNSNGTISNYAQAYDAQLNYVNAIIAQYNAMDATAQESFKDTVEQAKQDFETFVDNVDKYDSLISETIPGLEKDIQSAIDKQIEIQIQEFNMEIKIRLDLAEAERDWNQFKKKIIDGIKDSDILGNTAARLLDYSSYYNGDNNGIVQANARHVNDILAQLYQMDRGETASVYGDNRKQALEDLQTYYKQLMSDLEDVAELQQEIHESYIDMMDEAQEKFDEQINTYEMINNLITHDSNLISLVYGDEAYGKLVSYYNKQENNYNSQLEFQRQQVDFWRQQMDILEESSEEWEVAKEKWMSAVDEWNSAVEDAISNLQDKYLNAINLIFQNLNNHITGGLGLDYVNEEWKLINDNANQYLDTINSLYEVQKLEDKYLDAIDKTDNVASQRQLKELMDAELADLRERDKLTQYDIERANKKYEIALKQIALQEAQKNKSTMRLKRDSQGNYSYQYVADTDSVGAIQDELADMYNSLYNFDKNRYQDNLNQLYSVWEEFQTKMAEAAQINDPQARAERELLLQEQYGELINGLVEQNETVRINLHESAFTDLSRLYQVGIEDFQAMSDEEKEILMGDLVPYWESGIQQMADTFAGEGGFLGVCQSAFEELNEATKNYEDGLIQLEDSADVSFNEIANDIDETIYQTQDLLQGNQELINSYEIELDAIRAVINELDGLVAKYDAARQAAIAATTAAYNYWAQEQKKAGNAAGTGKGTSTQSSTSNSNSSNSRSGATGTSSSVTAGDGRLVVGDTATFTGQYYYDSFGTSPVGNRYAGVAQGIVVDKINNNPYGIHIHSADGKFMDLGWIKKSQLTGYATGGYTGAWGTSGKLALLHQKELVLNESDTKNMLNAVQILRSVTNTLGGSILSRLNGISANTAISNGESSKGQLEQNVHIDATFPNVTNSREIENAFNNLMNVAVQRINQR